MTWSYNTGDRYHTQNTSYYCGAACAMMILAEIGVPYSSLDQDVLYNSNHSHNHNSGWYTDPYGLCYTLNDRRPASFLPNYFVVDKPLTEALGTRIVVFTLYHYKVSPAVLVYHCAHWNVVRGVKTDVDPTTGAPYIVEGFWLNNPVWDTSITTHDGTDTCGSGGSHGIANEFVTYAEWQTNRFNGCAFDDPGGATQWIAVCDPEPPNNALPRRRDIAIKFEGRHLIESEQVAELAENGLREYRLRETEFGERALHAGKPGQPLLVQRLDRPGDFYYLTPWEQDGRVAALIDVDARFGVFKSVRILSEPAESWMIGAKKGNVRSVIGRAIDDKVFDLPDEKGRFSVFPGTYCIPPVLVWKPCRESWSPHLPFYHVVVGGHSLYVRIDGPVFTHLTSGKGA